MRRLHQNTRNYNNDIIATVNIGYLSRYNKERSMTNVVLEPLYSSQLCFYSSVSIILLQSITINKIKFLKKCINNYKNIVK